MATLLRTPASIRADALVERVADNPVLALATGAELGATPAPSPEQPQLTEPSRALALSDVIAVKAGPGEALMRLAYRLGVPGHALAAPFRRPQPLRVLATVESPNRGDRAAGTALRAGHFLIHGARLPIASFDFSAAARHAPGVERVLHSFSWLADLAASAPRADGAAVAERIATQWLHAHRELGKGPAWEPEHAGLRLMAWLVHAPLVLGGQDKQLKSRLLAAIAETAGWLDKHAPREAAGFGQVTAWAGVVAAGLLLPHGKPRRLFGEAGLVKALGDMVGEDGGLLSRCPAAQLDAIRLLTDLIACYEAAEVTPPAALEVMRELLVPPLLALRHGDGMLGSWQGQGAISADRINAVIEASGVRTRPLSVVQGWGYQRAKAGETLLQFDTAPPPRAKHARTGCASTLAFELSDGPQRVIVNCGGAALAGGQVPARIGQGLRATAAFSTLVLDNANSTAVLLNGQLGKGVETVNFDRRTVPSRGREATRIDAAHDGYASRFGLTHQRILTLSGDGTELAGEDLLIPTAKNGKRGKIAFALRFHLGRGVEVQLSGDKRGASLLLPDGRLWQFRLGGDRAGADAITLTAEDSLWVDGDGRPHATEQLVIEGLALRSGGQFSWLFRKTG
ncbi:putative heparinase superfamily protein [Erythromicrobium ramosum]|uniref:Heparinase n=1 Tax=Erythrobacter ramosus TaxID=35811 RepID=A0A6I4UK93_9SPHN|nr:heparinase II/III family protein [Erythrobacter ramosus]MBB3774582.1 putative heparinase superfamily protein [Erythrobacter ramosus]MXP37769.1 heparinase [Erythrobacter ramosus]